MCFNVIDVSEVCWRLFVLFWKLVFISCIVGVWFILAYLQSRVWNELPLHLERSTQHVMPTFGCADCSDTAQSATLFLCNGCKLYNQTQSHYSHAVMNTAYEIEREFKWLIHLELVSHYLILFVKTVATKPALVATWMLALQMASTAAFGLMWLFGTCRKGMKQFKMDGKTLRPRGVSASLPSDFQGIIETDGGGNDDEGFNNSKLHFQ